MNPELSVNTNAELKTIEKVLVAIKETYYEGICTNNICIKEEKGSLRQGRILKKTFVLKSNAFDLKNQIEQRILKQTNYASRKQFYQAMLSLYEEVCQGEANENNALLIISELLSILKRANVFFCEDKDTKDKAMEVYFEKIAHEWLNEHFIIAYINMFELFPMLQKVLAKEKAINQYPIEKKITLISIFYLKEYYDYTLLISEAIEDKNEFALVKIFRLYPEALDYFVNDHQLDHPLSITVVVDILQLPFIKKDSAIVKILISDYAKLSSDNPKDYNEYFKIIIKLLDNNQNTHLNLIINSTNAILLKLIELNQWQTAHQIISNFKYKTSLSLNVASSLLSITPFDYVKFISTIIELYPSLYDQICKEYLGAKKIKELIKLIQCVKGISLNKELYETTKQKSLKRFYRYKYENCKDQLDILIDYIINDPPFFNYILKRYLNQSLIPEVLYLVKLALTHSIPLTEKTMNSLMTKFGSANLEEIIKTNSELNTIVIEDYFGPKQSTSVTLSKEINIVFADTPSQVNSFVQDYLINSDYLGIDSEWKQNYTPFNRPEVSILQLCDAEEKNIIIIDMIKLKNSKKFIEQFSMIKKKKLIGYSFEASDISNITNKEIVNIFKSCDIINLGKPPFSNNMSLSSLYKQKLNREICKYEQCSNWNNRPLRKKQLHYAALDSLLCIQLYKCFINANNCNNKV